MNFTAFFMFHSQTRWNNFFPLKRSDGIFFSVRQKQTQRKIHQTFYFQMCHSNTSIRPPTHCTFWLKQTTGNKQTNKLCLRLRSKKKRKKKSNFSDYTKKKRKTSSVCHRNPFTHLQQKPRIT